VDVTFRFETDGSSWDERDVLEDDDVAGCPTWPDRETRFRTLTLLGPTGAALARFPLGPFLVPGEEIGLWGVVRAETADGPLWLLTYQACDPGGRDARRDFFCWDGLQERLRPANFVGDIRPPRAIEYLD
jgi:hypothetical protein